MKNSGSADRPQSIAIYGGSFNPPGLHHRQVANLLAAHFSQVMIVPCGFRNDKVRQDSDWMAAGLRRVLLEAAFGDDARFNLDFRDLDSEGFTTTADLAEIYQKLGEPHFLVGADLLVGGGTGESAIQQSWYRGRWIWENLNWVCLERPGYPLADGDLPPRRILISADITGSSTLIRQRLRLGQSVATLVSPVVEQILIAQGAYR